MLSLVYLNITGNIFNGSIKIKLKGVLCFLLTYTTYPFDAGCTDNFLPTLPEMTYVALLLGEAICPSRPSLKITQRVSLSPGH